jgi:hypothetical protein
VKLGQKAHQVLQRATEPIDRPGHDDIELAPARVFPKLVKGRPLVASLGARYAVIAENPEHFPAGALGNLP